MKLSSWPRYLLLSAHFAMALFGSAVATAGCPVEKQQVCINSLTDLSVPALRGRTYASTFQPLEQINSDASIAFMFSYGSEDLRLYSRLDLPPSPTPQGLPVVVLAPGWISRDEAASWDFGSDPVTTVGTVRDAMVSANFAVLTVGYRGRGKVSGISSEGMEFRDAWGNGSYLSPIFYTLDLLNALAGLPTLQDIGWTELLPETHAELSFDLTRVSLWGHSQGGDVVATALAVLGSSPSFPQPLHAASIWSGNIPDRFTQANTFGPMGSTLQAFMSGDGTWTGSALGRNGESNPEFIFPWPADWIGTVETTSSQWTWQAQQWATPSVSAALQATYGEMYATLNAHVRALSGLTFQVAQDASGRTVVRHAKAVAEQMPQIGGYNHAQWIDTPLHLHVSDRDYYSLPDWNTEFAGRVNAGGGDASVFIYPGTNHGLRKSKHAWFSPEGTKDGVSQALARDISLFRGNDTTN